MDPRAGALVGRQRELGDLAEALADAAGGRGQVVLVVGEPGIGKTRLLEEAARLAGQAGFAVAWGRAWEAGGAPTYWPWIELLRALLAGQPDPAAGELRRLLPEVDRGGGPRSPEAGDRFQLFDAVAGYLAASAARQPICLVLDDLHAADPSSLELLVLVAARLRDSRTLIIGSHRDVEARLSREVGEALARVAREARVLSPARLSPDEVRALVATMSGPLAELAAEVHAASEGNPLFARELVRLVIARGREATSGLPEGVRAVIRQRLALLGGAALRLLGSAAILGRDVDLGLAAEVAGESPAALAEAFAEATRAELLHAQASGRFRFSHALVGETLLADLPPARRAEQHARAAAALEARHAGDVVAPLDRIAHHWLNAGTGHAARAATAAEAAARRATAQLAFEDAAVLYASALAALAQAAPAQAPRRATLLLAQAEAHARAGQLERGRAACLAAAEVARLLADGELLARVALTWGAEVTAGIVDARLIALLEESLAVLPPGDGPWRARVLARLAGARQPEADPRPPMQLAREAMAMARRLGDRQVLLAVLHAGMAALMDYAHPDERAPLNRETARLAMELGDRPVAFRARLRLVFDHLELLDRRGFDHALAEHDALAAEFRQARYHWPGRLLHAAVAEWEGRHAEAEAGEAEADALIEASHDEGAREAMRFRRFITLVARERPPDQETERVVAAAFAFNPFFVRYIAAWIAARLGRLDEARRLLADEPLAEMDVVAWDGNLSAIVVETIVWLGDRARAAALYERLLPRAGRACVATGVGHMLQDTTSRLLLQLAAVLGQAEDVERHAEAALAELARLRARPLAARARADWATFLASRGDPRAAELAREALAVGEALDMPGLVARCRRLLGGEAPATQAVSLVRDGELWLVAGPGEQARLKDSRGLHMLAALLAEPERELHVLELAGASEAVDAGDAGEALDREARQAYQARLASLRGELAEAERWHDPARRERLTGEIEELEAQLAGALGLGGRERRSGRAVERARVNVQRRIADALKRIGEVAPGAGRHLFATIRTGTTCVYRPDTPRAAR